MGGRCELKLPPPGRPDAPAWSLHCAHTRPLIAHVSHKASRATSRATRTSTRRQSPQGLWVVHSTPFSRHPPLLCVRLTRPPYRTHLAPQSRQPRTPVHTQVTSRPPLPRAAAAALPSPAPSSPAPTHTHPSHRSRSSRSLSTHTSHRARSRTDSSAASCEYTAPPAGTPLAYCPPHARAPAHRAIPPHARAVHLPYRSRSRHVRTPAPQLLAPPTESHTQAYCHAGIHPHPARVLRRPHPTARRASHTCCFPSRTAQHRDIPCKTPPHRTHSPSAHTPPHLVRECGAHASRSRRRGQTPAPRATMSARQVPLSVPRAG
ncbi:hypothetical protein DFH06DRAFT_1346759 [Mycena polygramma]|nr:hypothetical protein DFH06DRAFT_1346759 [Mycena polygramma]